MPVEFVRPTLLGTTTQSRVLPQGHSGTGLINNRQTANIIQRGQQINLQQQQLRLAQDNFLLRQDVSNFNKQLQQDEAKFNLLKFQLKTQEAAMNFQVMPGDQEAFNAEISNLQTSLDQSDHGIDATSQFASEAQKILLKFAPSRSKFIQLQKNQDDLDKMSIENKFLYNIDAMQADIARGEVKDLSSYLDNNRIETLKNLQDQTIQAELTAKTTLTEGRKLDNRVKELNNDVQQNRFNNFLDSFTGEETNEQIEQRYLEFIQGSSGKAKNKDLVIFEELRAEGLSASEALARMRHSTSSSSTTRNETRNTQADVNFNGGGGGIGLDKEGKINTVIFPDGDSGTKVQMEKKLPKGAVIVNRGTVENPVGYVKVKADSAKTRDKLIELGILPADTDNMDEAPNVITDGNFLLIPLNSGSNTTTSATDNTTTSTSKGDPLKAR